MHEHLKFIIIQYACYSCLQLWYDKYLQKSLLSTHSLIRCLTFQAKLSRAQRLLLKAKTKNGKKPAIFMSSRSCDSDELRRSSRRSSMAAKSAIMLCYEEVNVLQIILHIRLLHRLLMIIIINLISDILLAVTSNISLWSLCWKIIFQQSDTVLF